MATITLTYVFFEREKKLLYSLVAYNISSYVLPVLFLNIHAPLLGYRDYPYDEIAVYLVAIAWISVIARIYTDEKDNFISDLKSNNEKLQRTKEELERFTYIASHDLKSPLRTIISFLDLLERDLRRGQLESLPSHLEFAKTGAHQLNYIIQDVLEISKLNSKFYKKLEWLELSAVIEKSIANLSKEIKDKNAIVEVGDLPLFYGNEMEFLLLFQNIMHNGIKYNLSDVPTVKIWASQEPGFYKLHFKDNGIGIESEYFEQIFEHFKRLHNSQKYPGTGLGLALCKKIALGYNGDITISSKVGAYSIFTVSLPISAPN